MKSPNSIQSRQVALYVLILFVANLFLPGCKTQWMPLRRAMQMEKHLKGKRIRLFSPGREVILLVYDFSHPVAKGLLKSLRAGSYSKKNSKFPPGIVNMYKEYLGTFVEVDISAFELVQVEKGNDWKQTLSSEEKVVIGTTVGVVGVILVVGGILFVLSLQKPGSIMGNRSSRFP